MEEKSNKNKTSVLLIILFSLAFLTSLLLAPGYNANTRLLMLGVILAIYSVYSFFTCGGKVVNASSIASYGTLMFIAFPSIYTGLGLNGIKSELNARNLIIGLSLAFLFQTALILASRMRNAPYYYEEPGSSRATGMVERQLIRPITRFSLFMLLGTVVSKALGLGVPAAGFSWICILAASFLVFFYRDLSLIIKGSFLALAAFMVETGFSVGEFGRLNLAVLALSVVVIASFGLRSWFVKFTTLIVTAPALIFLVRQRINFLESERGGSVNESEGIGSVVSPFQSAGTIIDAVNSGILAPSWGSSIWAALVVWIPRAWWEDKPVGFGREIVEITQPGLANVKNFSDSATFIGEIVWNFGVLGAPFFLLVLAYLIHILDRWLGAFKYDFMQVYGNFIFFLLVALCSGTLLNLIWGSTFTLTSRTLFPIVVLLLAWVLGPKRHQVPTRTAAPRLL